LAEGVDAVFTERPVTDAFAGLRAIGPDGLREFMPRHA
jgi:hypothetical protein